MRRRQARERLILAFAFAMLGGCAAGVGSGVRKRIVSATPYQRTPVLLGDEVARGHVRGGIFGEVAPLASDGGTAGPEEGGHVAPAGAAGGWFGAAFAERAEVAVAAMAFAPGDDASVDELPFAPQRRWAQGYALEVRQISKPARVRLQAHASGRLYQIPFAWDFGDCFEVDGRCLSWDRKGGPSLDETAWAIGVQLGLTVSVEARPGLLVLGGFQFENLPSMPTTGRDDLLCNSLGQCTGGRRPGAPGAESQQVSGGGFVGAIWRPMPHVGLRVLVNPVAGPRDGPTQWLTTTFAVEVMQ